MWGHCHHKATGDMSAEQTLLERMGLDVDPVSGGCCGLAGSWGFEQGHYDVSMQSGELALLPAVRRADPGTIVVADGFSCKTQVEQAGTGRAPMHVAQVMQLARRRSDGGRESGGRPEAGIVGARPAPPLARRITRAGGVLASLAALGVAAGVAARGLR
jgi:hypothetical protein